MLRYIFILLFLVPLVSCGQKETYPKGYFMFPILPNQQNSLSGAFGDLRTNHFHAGIDIRTLQREGLDVFAAADGYVSRIKIATNGYGNVLYITHPNGYTTLYGHLKTFSTNIAQYVRAKQYQQQSFDIELIPNANEIQVRKGQIIGASGNSGSSGGPHLHFEIRDKNENALNPLHFGFSEIQDNRPPLIDRLVLRTMNANARINQKFGRFVYNPVMQQGAYTLLAPIAVWGEIGIEMLAFDRMDDSPFRCGVSEIEMQLDGKLVYEMNLEKMPFDISKDMNAHIDYATAEIGDGRIQKCYVSDGNRLPVYKTNTRKGKISITDTLFHQALLTVKDAVGNTSILYFSLKGERPQITAVLPLNTTQAASVQTSISENTLVIKAKNIKSPSSQAMIRLVDKVEPINLSYSENNESVYFWDLRKGIPFSVQVEDGYQEMNIRNMIRPKSPPYAEDNLSINFKEALYDTLYLNTQKLGDRLSINSETIALKEPIEVTWLPNISQVSDKMAVYNLNDGKKFVGGTWGAKGISFNTKELGNFQVLTDYNPPSIRPVFLDSMYFRCVIKDDLSGIKNFRCTIDGDWVLMNYDYKRALIWSERQFDDEYFGSILRLEVTDNSGNVAIFETDIDEYLAKQRNEAIRRKSSSRNRSKKRKR